MNVVDYNEIEKIMHQWGSRCPNQRINIETALDFFKQKSFSIKKDEINVKEFDDYVKSIRQDWSSFDGRELLSKWNKLKGELK
jgi:hypothetical protein